MVVYSYKSVPTVSSLWEDGRRVYWGNRRNPIDWREKEAPGTPHLFTRGFTGHEHLDKYDIINMNGRLYDPTIGRFFSPDPFVQTPGSTQGFNRYSYCMNNPLMYTDPDGEFIIPILVGIAIGVGISATSYTAAVAMSDGGLDNWNWKDFGKSVGIGALGGALTGGFAAAGSSIGLNVQSFLFQSISSTVSNSITSLAFNGSISGYDVLGGFVGGALGAIAGNKLGNLVFGEAPKHIGGVFKGAISGAIGGFVGGASSQYIRNGFKDFDQALLYGAKSAAFGAIQGGIVEGIQAARHGRNIWTGERQKSSNGCYSYGSLDPKLPNQYKEFAKDIEPFALTLSFRGKDNQDINIPIIGWKFNSSPAWQKYHWPAWQANSPILIPFIPWTGTSAVRW